MKIDYYPLVIDTQSDFCILNPIQKSKQASKNTTKNQIDTKYIGTN